MELVETVQPAVQPSHLLLNALSVRQFWCDGVECPCETEEKSLFSALRLATQALLAEGIAVDATFQLEDDTFYSPEVDEEIVSWESLGLVGERPGSRYIFYTDQGVERFPLDALDRSVNTSISPRAVEIIRETVAACLRA